MSLTTKAPRRWRRGARSLAIAAPKDRMMKRRTEVMEILQDYLHLTD